MESLRDAIGRHARLSLGVEPASMTLPDAFRATALAVRDRAVAGMLATERAHRERDRKRVYYLSMEYLLGRSLGNGLAALDLERECREALAAYGFALDAVLEAEPDAALGNGGLGRLAACYLDSMATHGLAGFGYGILYEYGIFRQDIVFGEQRERPDNWLAEGSPWLIERCEERIQVPVYGRVIPGIDARGRYNPMWVDWRSLLGVPYDMPVVGHGGATVNWLRLFRARAPAEIDMEIFNTGDYFKAVERKLSSETVSKVLYPSDHVEPGRELRLLQEYFFAACAVRDATRRYLRDHDTFDAFPDRVVFHLNDTHPALAIADFMRVLVDEADVPWEKAWDLTVASFAYTNHTLLPEALERWPVALLERMVPRHLEIVYEVNRRFLDGVRSSGRGAGNRIARLSLFEEAPEKLLRMAHLAVVGSRSVNGVARLHSRLLRTELLPEFAEIWPERFGNVTNGVTQRRWMLLANPGLAALLRETLGDAWIRDLEALRGLERHAHDAPFRDAFRAVKRAAKERLARRLFEDAGVRVDPAAMFDVHAKRIHEYKRQLMNVLRVLGEYLALAEEGREPPAPRLHLFAGKAAPGYRRAKQVIRLVHDVGEALRRDPRTRGKLEVAFLPDYRVSLAEFVMPGADLSEQISTAGTEASGTGNMKFALNGALTIATLDGANVEMAEELGAGNLFVFGLRVEEIREMRHRGAYDPRALARANPYVARVLDAVASGRFWPREPERHRWVLEALFDEGDEYFVVADLPSYAAAQERAAREFLDPTLWHTKAILGVARMGRFSSDRAVAEYARDVWRLA